MNKYIIEMTDGSVSIMSCKNGATPEECVAKWVPERQANVVAITPIESDSVPRDRTFRRAWKHLGGKVDIDMPKARDVMRDKMRLARQSRLEALDVAQLRGLDVAAEKQTLRDVTDLPGIEAAKTPEELKAVWPSDLLGEEIPRGLPK